MFIHNLFWKCKQNAFIKYIREAEQQKKKHTYKNQSDENAIIDNNRVFPAAVLICNKRIEYKRAANYKCLAIGIIYTIKYG